MRATTAQWPHVHPTSGKGSFLLPNIPLNHSRASSKKRLTAVFLIVNAAGMTSYLMLASRGWRILEEHAAIPVTGEPFVWALALPVLGVSLVVDAVWGVLLVRQRMGKEWRGWR